MQAKEWLEKEEWDNLPVDSQKWSHYTMMDTIMEEYAKVYLKMTDEDFKFRQGRSKRQYENNAKAGFYASVALFFTLLGIIIYGLLTV